MWLHSQRPSSRVLTEVHDGPLHVSWAIYWVISEPSVSRKILRALKRTQVLDQNTSQTGSESSMFYSHGCLEEKSRGFHMFSKDMFNQVEEWVLLFNLIISASCRSDPQTSGACTSFVAVTPLAMQRVIEDELLPWELWSARFLVWACMGWVQARKDHVKRKRVWRAKERILLSQNSAIPCFSTFKEST